MNTKVFTTDKEFTFGEFYSHYIKKYLPQYYMYFPGHGYIVWRFGSGENIELLHIRSFKIGQGLGQRLIKAMLRENKNHPPFHSVFGMTLASNTSAIKMYTKAGFKTMECPFPYKGGNSIIFYQRFDVLCQTLLADDLGDPSLMENIIKSECLS